jgi:hypothetical protein
MQPSFASLLSMALIHTLLSLLLLVSALASPSIAAGDSSFPATGQRKCWNSAGAKVACAGTGHDGQHRAGAAMLLRDNSDGTIADLNTGLVWEKMSRDGGIHDRSTLLTWDQALAKVAALNTPPCFAGHCNWRLPNVKELHSTVDFDRAGLALSKLFLKSCQPGCTVATCSCSPAPASASGFWSSTTDAEATTQAWQLHHGSGATKAVAKSSTGYARAVASPECTKATLTVSVAFAGGDAVAGVTVDVDYPELQATIPGFGGSVTGISNLTGVGGGIFSSGDDDSIVSVGLVSLGQAIPAGPFAAIAMDCVAGTRAPFRHEFACTAVASNAVGADVATTCSLAIAYE